MKILLPGGAGYIGSHTTVELQSQGHDVVIFDNFSNSDPGVLERIEQISGVKSVLVEGDLMAKSQIHSVFEKNKIDAVIHFAALKSVGESVAEPLRYYQNNITGTLNLLEVMEQHRVSTLIFSSSATVYGEPSQVPITESESIKPTNPYGQTKAMIEQILLDAQQANKDLKVGLLRYFNPVGAHASGLIGESPSGIPNNLMPYISQVAVGLREQVNVYGNDYPTPDGTGVRDYLHVVDLAQAHVASLDYLSNTTETDPLIVNLGTGRGHSVLEVVKAFEKASGKTIPFEFVDRRPGDIPTCYADPTRAKDLLNWTAQHNLDAMCRDAWHWQNI
jgi:UDP-glucose 4-epimerase